MISTSRRSLFLCLLLPASLYRPVDAKLVERKILVEEKLATPDRRRNQVAAGGGHHVDDDGDDGGHDVDDDEGGLLNFNYKFTTP